MTLTPATSRGTGLPLGLTGATQATRYVGGTATVAPTTGTFAVGDYVIGQNGTLFVCTVAGTPGTWSQVGAGSSAGVAKVHGPFPFAFNTANLNNGLAFYTPTVGDIMLNAWVEITTAFDGTTPKIDIGSFAGNPSGWFAIVGAGALDGTSADLGGTTLGTGILVGSISSEILGYAALSTVRVGPARFTGTNPLLVVVSTTGAKGDAAPGGTHGAGNVYIEVATPTTP